MAKRKRQRDTGGQQSDPAWQAITDKYPGNPALQAETLYALPPSLIDAITATAPGVQTDNDERFERDSTAAAPCGFHRQFRFSYPPLLPQSPTTSPPSAKNASVQRSVNNLKAMLRDDMLERGVPAIRAAEYFT